MAKTGHWSGGGGERPHSPAAPAWRAGLGPAGTRTRPQSSGECRPLARRRRGPGAVWGGDAHRELVRVSSYSIDVAVSPAANTAKASRRNRKEGTQWLHSGQEMVTAPNEHSREEKWKRPVNEQVSNLTSCQAKESEQTATSSLRASRGARILPGTGTRGGSEDLGSSASACCRGSRRGRCFWGVAHTRLCHARLPHARLCHACLLHARLPHARRVMHACCTLACVTHTCYMLACRMLACVDRGVAPVRSEEHSGFFTRRTCGPLSTWGCAQDKNLEMPHMEDNRDAPFLTVP